MLEASLNALHLAINSLATTDRHDIRESSSKNSIEIGLIGVATELAMTSTLVHAYGPSIHFRESGNYKSFPEILSDFRTLVREARPNSDFLVDGLSNPSLHRQELISRTSNFRILATTRAGGLHAGKGPETEAAFFQANEIVEFLKCLAKSNKIKPYLHVIPECTFYQGNRTVIIEDLSRRLSELNGAERDSSIASLFLVLPDIPQEHPDWIDTFDRFSIAPKSRDVSYLLNVLDDAIPATLRRANQRGNSIAVRVEQDNPDALPIAPSYLRRHFNERRDQLMADIGSANGRLNDNFLDLPPPESVREMFAIGLRGSGILENADYLTAHEAWPFIASSLNVQGTTGPYWFIVRSTNDLGQLEALIRRASQISGPRLTQNFEEFEAGLNAIRNDDPIIQGNVLFEDQVEDLANAEEKRTQLMQNFDRHQNNERALPEELLTELEEVINGATVDNMLTVIKDGEYGFILKRYWLNILSEVSLDHDDLAPLIEILNDNDFINAHTTVRKALRRIDFRMHGPPISTV